MPQWIIHRTMKILNLSSYQLLTSVPLNLVGKGSRPPVLFPHVQHTGIVLYRQLIFVLTAMIATLFLMAVGALIRSIKEVF